MKSHLHFHAIISFITILFPTLKKNFESEGLAEVQLVIGRNFGLPAAESLMTTACTVGTGLPAGAAPAPAAAAGSAGPDALDVRLLTTFLPQMTDFRGLVLGCIEAKFSK